MEVSGNITNQVASSISKLKLNTAHRAFEAQNNENKNQDIEPVEQKNEATVEPMAEKMAVDVEDIQKYAKYMGENLSIDDINYGLMYGRSVIADYSV